MGWEITESSRNIIGIITKERLRGRPMTQQAHIQLAEGFHINQPVSAMYGY